MSLGRALLRRLRLGPLLGPPARYCTGNRADRGTLPGVTRDPADYRAAAAPRAAPPTAAPVVAESILAAEAAAAESAFGPAAIGSIPVCCWLQT